MIRLCTDAAFLNEILNDPAVHPWVCGANAGPIDITPVLSNPSNIALVTDHGGFIFAKIGSGVYDVHTQFKPEGRGTALAAAKEAAQFMFTYTDCIRIETMVPEVNKAARLLTERMGFTYQGRHGVWLVNGVESPSHYFSLEKG